MKIALISFTGRGAMTCRIIADGLRLLGYECGAFGKEGFAQEAGISPLEGSLSQWTEAAFRDRGALVFVGACGIAVRAVAPYIKDKTVDPAVIVVDEMGKYAISLLSGHLGGANELTCKIAGLVGAVPVITTATDLNQKFAVDDWAKKNRLLIGDMKIAKEISAAILNGEEIGVSSDFPIEGELPAQLRYVKERGGQAAGPGGTDDPGVIDAPGAGKLPRLGIRISLHDEEGPFERTLHLIPRTVTVGMGCRKGIDPAAAESLLHQVLKENRLSVKSIEALCTIDIKKEEAALHRLAEGLGVSLRVFSAAELSQLTDEFTASAFVSQITGVDNVCERAAVLGSRGSLISGKKALNGVTVALAQREEKYKWTQQ